ncbi:MAG: hypothetical protein FD141_806 [Fusobacteria bacterium]|nr:MAG: hypothetical protein FD141_806 [Fusobacteriota bacterium]KAF0228528.1 MAG: hypothetical protein FD182_784 [Fusobacteriota bacterium]
MKFKITLRYLMFITGLFLMGMAISLTAKSNLGTTPIFSVPFLISLITPLSIGTLVFLLTLSFVILEFILLKGKFNKEQYMQLLLCPIFGFFVDTGMYVFRFVNPIDYFSKVVVLVIACFLLAFGIYIQIIANVVINPAEGLVKIISEKTGMKFGNVKILFDSTLLLIAIIISLSAFGKIISVREGTFVVALATGSITKLYMSMFKKLGIDRLSENKEPTD